MEKEKLVWDDKLKIGVEVVDKAHAKLFKIVEKLLEISEDENSGPHTYIEAIKYLEAYSMTHFAEEEAYMRSIKYKGYAQHKRLHDAFRDKTLVSLRNDLERSGYSSLAVRRFAGIMERWLLEHIMQEDQAIVGRCVSRSHDDQSSQTAIIAKAVDRAVRNAFQVEATLVSTDHKGENIGKCFYYRQGYTVEGKIQVQVLLGIAELLLLRGANRLLELKLIRRNEMQDEIVRKVFAVLFKDLGKLFGPSAQEEPGQESRLTRDEFRADFMKGYACRLLFDTKAGPLIFCYRSWRVKEQQPDGAEENTR